MDGSSHTKCLQSSALVLSLLLVACGGGSGRGYTDSVPAERGLVDPGSSPLDAGRSSELREVYPADTSVPPEVADMNIDDPSAPPEVTDSDGEDQLALPEIAEVSPPEIAAPAGVWTDPESGFVWQNPVGFLTLNWEEAKQYCSELTLAGGGWHLPTMNELRSLVVGCPATEPGGPCNIESDDCLQWLCRDDSCIGCPFFGGPAESGCYWPDEMKGKCASYWASSDVEDKEELAWHIGFQGAYISPSFASEATHVRCVR